MSSPARRWSLLIVHPRSQRLLDETWRDIDKESAGARTPAARLTWAARSGAAMLRILPSVMRCEAAAIVASSIGWRIGMFTAGLLALVVGWPLRDYAAQGMSLAFGLLLIPQALVLVLPVSIFWGALSTSPRPRMSPLGLALGGAVLVLAPVLVYPYANQQFRLMAFEETRGVSESGAADAALLKGTQEVTLAELYRATRNSRSERPSSSRARQEVALRMGFLALTGSLAVFGVLARNASGRRRLIYAAAPVVALVALVPLFGPPPALWAVSAMGLGGSLLHGPSGEAPGRNTVS